MKSCEIADRGDGASFGACEWARVKTDSRKHRDKLVVLNTLAFIIFAPRSAQPNGAPPIYSELGRCFGAHRAKLRYVFFAPTGAVTGSAQFKNFSRTVSVGPCQHTIRNQDLIVPFEGFEDGLTGRQRGRALAGCTPGAASFFRAERPGCICYIAARAHRALTLHEYGCCGVVRN